jgi:enoyl-[acyl-carrier protein] reductase II
MYPEVLREHIQKCKKETSETLLNVPMLYPNIEEIMKIIVEEGVKIVFYRQEIQNMDSII